jgi:hypothetical protein
VLPQLPAESENAQDEGPTLSRASSTTTVLNDANASGPYENALSIDQKDIQEIARFIREFVVQGLVPWMEKAVGEWNETVRALICPLRDGFDDVLHSMRQVAGYHPGCFRPLDVYSVTRRRRRPQLRPTNDHPRSRRLLRRASTLHRVLRALAQAGVRLASSGA